MDSLCSSLCTEEQLRSEPFQGWAERLRPSWGPPGAEPPLHRKLWEFAFIAQALAERDMLRPGRRGLGFGVGREPLVALFASMGCEVVATDADPRRARAAGWADANQYAGTRAELNTLGLCDPEEFEARVSFRVVDMNDIPADLRGFDFAWSSCALEHLGSIWLGKQFVLSQMECIRPGGVAVHTTEFNLSSDRQTIRLGGTVLFRARDLSGLVARLWEDGHRVGLDLGQGSTAADLQVAEPSDQGPVHLRVRIGPYVSTSAGLIVEKSPVARTDPDPAARFRRQLARRVAASQAAWRDATRRRGGVAWSGARQEIARRDWTALRARALGLAGGAASWGRGKIRRG